MTADEFDREHSAPLAPDERMWRHPAEHADAERNKHLSHTPPLGRRLTALTATVSIVASLAILFIAIPKGINEYVEAVETPTTLQRARVKNSLLSLVATAIGAKGPTTAVSLGNGIWAVAADSIDVAEPIWVTSETGHDERVTYLSTSTDQSVVLLRTGAHAQSLPTVDWEVYLAPKTVTELQGLTLLDIHGIHRISDEQVFTMQAEPDDIPLMSDSPIAGIAAIVKEPMSLVGIAITTHLSTWFVPKETLSSLVTQPAYTAP